MSVLILDADGVFLDERPYWNAALGAAFLSAGLAPTVGDRWESLAHEAFEVAGLQRITKGAGCNSNWDLAAVLERALQRPATAAAVTEALSAERIAEAMCHLADGARALQSGVPGTDGDSGDPLHRFGIARGAAGVRAVAAEAQRLLNGAPLLPWRLERDALREPRAAIRSALESCAAAGWTLRVCTGRPRDEIAGALRGFDLDDLLPPDRIMSGSDVLRAETLSGRGPLGKPHWFPVLAAATDFENALHVLTSYPAATTSTQDPVLYAGDGWSDFTAVAAVRALGFSIDYVHVISPALWTERIETIRSAPGTAGVVSDLGGLVQVVTREAVR